MPERDLLVHLSSGVVMCSPFAYDSTFDRFDDKPENLAPVGCDREFC